MEEGIYVTSKGNYFIYGYGGPRSKYAVRIDNKTTGASERIRPVSREEAADLVHKYGSAEIFEQYFGDMIEEA